MAMLVEESRNSRGYPHNIPRRHNEGRSDFLTAVAELGGKGGAVYNTCHGTRGVKRCNSPRLFATLFLFLSGLAWGEKGNVYLFYYFPCVICFHLHLPVCGMPSMPTVREVPERKKKDPEVGGLS